jgi:hypothetical protein
MIMPHQAEINTVKILGEEITAPAIAVDREETIISGTKVRVRVAVVAGIITGAQEIITTITGILRKDIKRIYKSNKQRNPWC